MIDKNIYKLGGYLILTMAQKSKLWTTYAKKKFEKAGLEFEGWWCDDGTGKNFLNSSKKDEDSNPRDIYVSLSRNYSSRALDQLLNQSSGQFRLAQEGEITEVVCFSGTDGYVNFTINPNGKVIINDYFYEEGLPRKKDAKQGAERFLEQLVEYTERVLSPATEE